MNKASSVAAILSVVAAIASTPCALASTQARFRHIAAEVKKPAEENITLLPEVDSTLFIVREVDEIINSLEEPDFKPTPINKTLGPWIFSGYRKLQKKDFDNTIPTFFDGLSVLTNDSAAIATDKMIRDVEIAAGSDSIPLSETEFMEEIIDRHTDKDIDILADEVTPRWLRNALTSYRIQEDFMYGTMVSQPSSIDYSYWDLPERPKLPEDDISFAAYIRKLDLPEVDPEKAELPEQMKKKSIGCIISTQQCSSPRLMCRKTGIRVATTILHCSSTCCGMYSLTRCIIPTCFSKAHFPTNWV